MRKNLILTTFGLIALLLTAWPATAEAQRRGFGHGPGLRVGVVFGGGLFYDPWFQGRFPYPYPYPYPPYGYAYPYDTLTSALRLQVTPRQAEVYVDGYRAGIVDDFDGVFQRLHVTPGDHELVLYLDGYATVRQRIHLNPNTTEKIVYTMERLRPGETSGPRPEPQQVEQPAPAGPPMGRPGGRTPMAPAPPARPPMPPAAPTPPGDVQTDPSRIGSIAIRVQPANADILIDGEHWSGPAGQDRLVVQLSAGKHHLEVQKDGYEKFSADVQIRAGETTTVNVSLLRSGGGF